MKRIGFYSGSFDPVTIGHTDVIARACRLVDTLVIGIGVHPGKTPLFDADERIDMLKAETRRSRKTGARDRDRHLRRPHRRCGAPGRRQRHLARPARRHRLRLRDADGGHERRHGAGCRHGVPRRRPGRAAHHRQPGAPDRAMGGDVSPFVSPAVAQRLKAKAKAKCNSEERAASLRWCPAAYAVRRAAAEARQAFARLVSQLARC